MTRRSTYWLLATTVLAILAFAGCRATAPTPTPTASPVPPTPTLQPTKTVPPTTPANVGQIEVRATDALPNDVSRVLVTAKEIEAHMSGADEGKWTRLIADPPAFDLVAISGVEHMLGSNYIPVGDYTQVRVSIDQVVVTVGGKDVTADVPSDRLRFVTPFSIIEGQTTVIVIDFDAEKSVMVTGSDKVQFKPVVKLIVSRPPAKTPTPTAGATATPPTPTPAAGATATPATPAATLPGATPTSTPTAAIPFIPHPVAGRESCLVCHQSGMTTVAVPANHAGRGNNTCQVCHKTSGSIGGAPNIPHTLDSRADCLVCHQQKLEAPAFPANHSPFTNDLCTTCHQTR